jgi:hypothetical protein
MVKRLVIACCAEKFIQRQVDRDNEQCEQCVACGVLQVVTQATVKVRGPLAK